MPTLPTKPMSNYDTYVDLLRGCATSAEIQEALDYISLEQEQDEVSAVLEALPEPVVA